MDKSVRKIVLILVVVALVLILGFFMYTKSSGNENSSNNSNNGQNSGGNGGSGVSYNITKVYQVDLDAEEHAHIVGDKEVRLKLLNGELYVNDNKISGVKAQNAYVTDQVIIFTYKGKCHNIISYVVNKDGKEVPFTKNDYQLYDFRMLEGQCVAAGIKTCPCNASNNCEENYAITFTYNGSKLIVE